MERTSCDSTGNKLPMSIVKRPSSRQTNWRIGLPGLGHIKLVPTTFQGKIVSETVHGPKKRAERRPVVGFRPPSGLNGVPGLQWAGGDRHAFSHMVFLGATENKLLLEGGMDSGP